ncbi:CDP-glucose 4,6-dehydratase [Heliorestis convoluta]|uniref:CDP-glucose 4,6-dehydratase n=1 Tax=Heliorestis convoluta TaxID=356322 RepID=A0A5Q2N6A8_9FIRM|nr:CDP-glucose 4,6-dehydratase [Heliorestis convoluta]QGG48892.1 CDP-glucose 4,6-dehydratase [Heliorestis convoluta]
MTDSFYSGKNILVTGHTGFKGSWLTMWLKKMGANVTGYALEPPTNPSLFELCQIEKEMESIIGDIRNKETFAKTIKASKPAIIFHLAAQPIIKTSYQNPLETFETNIMGTANLLDILRTTPSAKALVIVTTDKCYHNNESFWGYKEDDRLGGHDPYSSSKACCELITDSYQNSFFHPNDYDNHGLAIATARAGNVIGGGDFAENRLIPDCVRALEKDEEIKIRNPHAIRPWQHVLEPLSGYLTLAERLYNEGPKYNGAWNFGPSEDNEKSVQYIVDNFVSLWGKGCWVKYDELDLHETSYLKLNSYKARQLLGYQTKWHIDHALKQVVDWTKVYVRDRRCMVDCCIEQIVEYEGCE